MTKFIVQIGDGSNDKYYGIFDSDEATKFAAAFEASSVIHPLIVVTGHPA